MGFIDQLKGCRFVWCLLEGKGEHVEYVNVLGGECFFLLDVRIGIEYGWE